MIAEGRNRIIGVGEIFKNVKMLHQSIRTSGIRVVMEYEILKRAFHGLICCPRMDEIFLILFQRVRIAETGWNIDIRLKEKTIGIEPQNQHGLSRGVAALFQNNLIQVLVYVFWILLFSEI